MKTSTRFIILLLIVSICLGACATPRADIYSQYDPISVANSGQPVSITPVLAQVETCQKTGETYRFTDETGQEYQVTLCHPNQLDNGVKIDIIDAAMIGTLITPWPGDEEIMAFVWIGKTLFVMVVAGTVAITADQVIETTTLDTAQLETIYLSHSNWNNNPNKAGSQARKNIKAFLAAMTIYLTGNGQDPRNKCGVTRDATGAIIRAAIWVADSSKATGGYLMWFFHNIPGTPLKGPWGGSYNITSDNFDKDRNAKFERDRGWTWTTGVPCDSIGVPTFLQAAQP